MSVIHTLRLRYSNAYLVVGARPMLVDTGSKGDAPAIVAGCAAAGVSIHDLAIILHTHVHSDHFGNTASLAAEAGCPVAYHPGDRALAMRGDNGPLRGVGLRGRILARLLHHVPFHTRAADIDAEDGARLDEYGIEACVRHTPGHTSGSISVVFDSGDAIIGDLLMGGYAGGMIRPTKPNLHYFADDLPTAMTSLDRLLAMTSGRLFVGHGGPLRHEDVRAWQRAMNATRRAIPID